MGDQVGDREGDGLVEVEGVRLVVTDCDGNWVAVGPREVVRDTLLQALVDGECEDVSDAEEERDGDGEGVEV